MRVCSECRENKPLDCFHKSAGRHKGLCNRCIQCAIRVAGEWYRNNKDRKRAYDAARREAKRHLYNQASIRWWKANPEKHRAGVSARRKRVRQNMPKWARPRDMKCFYLSAQRVTQCLGIKHEVDHVLPLRGQSVSGLHVPQNLRVVPESINCRKTNHYSITPDGKRA